MQILALLFLLAVGLGLVVLVVAALRSGRPGDRIQIPTALVRRADAMVRRSRLRVAIGAPAVLLTGGFMLAATFEVLNGLPAWAAALLAALGAGSAVVVLVGPPQETAAPIRSADLAVRTARGFGPGWAFTVPAVLAGLLVAAVVAAMVTADSVDGRDVLTWSTGSVAGSAGPYPGWHTGLPLLALLAVAGGLFAWALRRVAGWPRPTEQGLYALDDDIRRATTRMLLLGATGALLGALGAFASAVAGVWQTVLSNQQAAVANLTGSALPDPAWADPSWAESAWHAVQLGGLVMWVLGLALMVSAAVSGTVRTPMPADAEVQADSAGAAE